MADILTYDHKRTPRRRHSSASFGVYSLAAYRSGAGLEEVFDMGEQMHRTPGPTKTEKRRQDCIKMICYWPFIVVSTLATTIVPFSPHTYLFLQKNIEAMRAKVMNKVYVSPNTPIEIYKQLYTSLLGAIEQGKLWGAFGIMGTMGSGLFTNFKHGWAGWGDDYVMGAALGLSLAWTYEKVKNRRQEKKRKNKSRKCRQS